MSFGLKAALMTGALLMTAGAAQAAQGVATTALNVRSGPGGNYAVIDTLPVGERVTVLGCTAGWCEISMGPDGTGFASASFLDISGGGPRERVIVDEPAPIVSGVAIGGYWGSDPYYYDDGFYYYGGRWYGVRPGRPGWERSWRRDHRPRPGWGGPGRPGGGWGGPGRPGGWDGPGRPGGHGPRP
ncbi:MAG TPA: SH3 domain-containing protein, partial [Hansschlegelia sp.]